MQFIFVSLFRTFQHIYIHVNNEMNLLQISNWEDMIDKPLIVTSTWRVSEILGYFPFSEFQINSFLHFEVSHLIWRHLEYLVLSLFGDQGGRFYLGIRGETHFLKASPWVGRGVEVFRLAFSHWYMFGRSAAPRSVDWGQPLIWAHRIALSNDSVRRFLTLGLRFPSILIIPKRASTLSRFGIRLWQNWSTDWLF